MASCDYAALLSAACGNGFPKVAENTVLARGVTLQLAWNLSSSNTTIAALLAQACSNGFLQIAQIPVAAKGVILQLACNLATANGVTFSNVQVTHHVFCAIDNHLVYTGTLPSWITINASNDLVGAPGTFSGTSQAAANATAQTALDAFFAAADANGTLFCTL